MTSWTTTPPTRQGHYWIRPAGRRVEPVEILGKSMYVLGQSAARPIPEKTVTVEWQGPIRPEE